MLGMSTNERLNPPPETANEGSCYASICFQPEHKPRPFVMEYSGRETRSRQIWIGVIKCAALSEPS